MIKLVIETYTQTSKQPSLTMASQVCSQSGSWVSKRRTFQQQITPYTQFGRRSKPSVGMIVFSQSWKGETRYGLVKRKSGYGMKTILTLCFSDATCFTEVSNVERKALLYVCSMKEHWEHIFTKLWENSYWKSDTTSIHFKKCMEKFIQNRHIIKKMIEETTSLFPDGIWGFPKGHPERHETDIQCALREVKEETMVDKVTITTLPMQHETYKEWIYRYFVGAVELTQARNMLLENNPEISEVVWCTFEEAMMLIPADAVEKKMILTNVHKLITQ